MLSNKEFKAIVLPADRRVIKFECIFRNKHDKNRAVMKYKARIVALAYQKIRAGLLRDVLTNCHAYQSTYTLSSAVILWAKSRKNVSFGRFSKPLGVALQGLGGFSSHLSCMSGVRGIYKFCKSKTEKPDTHS